MRGWAVRATSCLDVALTARVAFADAACSAMQARCRVTLTERGLGHAPLDRLVADDGAVLAEADFRTAVEAAFRWLLNQGFRISTTAYGQLACSAMLTSEHRWLRLTWEAREDLILLSWGEVLPPGMFNDDPFRNPKAMQELIPGHSIGEIEAAGAIRDGTP